MEMEIKVPPIGESVKEATVARILQQENASVKKDDEIAELETDKANQMIYSPANGKIHWKVKEQDTVQVGQVIAALEEGAQENPPKEVQERPKETVEVEKAEEKPLEKEPLPKSKEGQTRKKMSKLRKVVAARLLQVSQETAMLTTFNEVDMSKVISVREKLKKEFLEKHQVKLGFVFFFAKAVCEAAVSTEKGLMVPVLKAVQNYSFADIEKTLRGFAEKARSGQISVQDLEGGTFTITNGGSFGSLLSTPILNPPQSGILGMHTIQERPVAIEGKVEIRPMMYIALSYDHRIVDGKEAIGFLKSVKEQLENPSDFFKA